MKIKTGKPFWFSALAVAVVGIVFYLFSDGAEQGAQASQVETTIIERGDIERTVASSGAVRPLITVEVGSQLSGQVSEIYVDFNSAVEKDQVIAQIDPQSFASRVLQNRAEMEVATANVTVQRANIERAEANLLKARLEFERSEPLAKQGTLSASDFDAARASYDSARADLTMAKAQLVNAQAALQQRQALLESAEIDLGRTKIRSPIDGVVIERAIDQGQTVAASLSSPVLFYIAQDLSEIQIEANVDEADIGNVKEGNPATFTVDAYPDSVFTGMVNQVRLAPNEQNNVVTYTVIVTASNPDLKLLPGMTAIVEIVTGKSNDVMRVANEAIRFKPSADSELAKLSPPSGPGNGGGPPGGGGAMRNVTQQAARLGLDEQQVQNIEQEVQEIVSRMRQSFRGGGDGSPPSDEQRQQMRSQMRQAVDEVFRKNLTAEQFDQLREIQREAEETRPGLLWIQSEDGEIRPVQLRFGIADDSYTQVLGRGIAEGDRAVTRIRKAAR